MDRIKTFAEKIQSEDFVITAEYLATLESQKDTLEILKNCGAQTINVADNPFGPTLSSLAGAIALQQVGIEPIYQLITRDRNRIALQSDLLGAFSLGITNVLCLSGYHQILTSSPQAQQVYDIDPIQLLQVISEMNKKGILLNGEKTSHSFSMFPGAVANPFIRPIELSILRLVKKVEAGARFIQTHAIFNPEYFQEWLNLVQKEGITEKAAIIASVFPLTSADEAMNITENYTDFAIPEEIVTQLKQAGNEQQQREQGIKICLELIKNIKKMSGVQGVHLMSGGKEERIQQILSSSDI